MNPFPEGAFQNLLYVSDSVLAEWNNPSPEQTGATYGAVFQALVGSMPGPCTFIVSAGFFGNYWPGAFTEHEDFWRRHFFVLSLFDAIGPDGPSCPSGDTLTPAMRTALDGKVALAREHADVTVGYYLADEPSGSFVPLAIPQGLPADAVLSATKILMPHRAEPFFGWALSQAVWSTRPGHLQLGCWYEAWETSWDVRNIRYDPDNNTCTAELFNVAHQQLLGVGPDNQLCNVTRPDGVRTRWKLAVTRKGSATVPPGSVSMDGLFLVRDGSLNQVTLSEHFPAPGGTWLTSSFQPALLSQAYQLLRRSSPEMRVLLADTGWFLDGYLWDPECTASYLQGIFPLRDKPYDILLLDQYNLDDGAQAKWFSIYDERAHLFTDKQWIFVGRAVAWNPAATDFAGYQSIADRYQQSFHLPRAPLCLGWWGMGTAYDMDQNYRGQNAVSPLTSSLANRAFVEVVSRRSFTVDMGGVADAGTNLRGYWSRGADGRVTVQIFAWQGNASSVPHWAGGVDSIAAPLASVAPPAAIYFPVAVRHLQSPGRSLTPPPGAQPTTTYPPTWGSVEDPGQSPCFGVTPDGRIHVNIAPGGFDTGRDCIVGSDSFSVTYSR